MGTFELHFQILTNCTKKILQAKSSQLIILSVLLFSSFDLPLVQVSKRFWKQIYVNFNRSYRFGNFLLTLNKLSFDVKLLSIGSVLRIAICIFNFFYLAAIENSFAISWIHDSKSLIPFWIMYDFNHIFSLLKLVEYFAHDPRLMLKQNIEFVLLNQTSWIFMKVSRSQFEIESLELMEGKTQKIVKSTKNKFCYEKGGLRCWRRHT